MRQLPVGAQAHFGQQRDVELGNARHQAGNVFAHPVRFFLGHFEHQLVVHLHHHPAAQFFAHECGIDGDHRHLDEVGRGALHRRIDGGALGRRPARPAGVDVGQPQSSPEHGFDIALLRRQLAGALHIRRDTRIAGEVAVDVELRRAALQAEVACQAEGAHAVDQPEVDDLGHAALIAADFQRSDAENLSRGRAVNVFPGGERSEQTRVLREVRHDAQLDLRVVARRDQPALGRDKRLANAPPLGRAYWNVLQIGIVGGQPPGHGHGLGVVGMHPAGVRVDHLRQLLGVGALEFGQAAVVENDARQRVIFGQLFQHFLVGGRGTGGGLFLHRQLQAVEQDFADLLGAAQIESAAGQLECLRFQGLHLGAQLAALRPQQIAVYQHAGTLDALQHFADLHFQRVNARQPSISLDLRPKPLVHLQGEIGIFAGIARRHIERHLIEGDGLGTLAADLFVAQGVVPAEVAAHQTVEAVRLVRLDHIALKQGVVRIAANRHARVGEHMAVVLGVLPELGFVGVFQPGPQAFEHLGHGQLLGRAGVSVGQRQIGGLAGRDAERNADQPCAHRVERVGFGVDGGELGRVDAGQPGVEPVPVENGIVGAWRALFGGRRAVQQRHLAGGLLAHRLRLHLGAEAAHAVAGEEGQQRLRIFRRRAQIGVEGLGVAVQIAVGVDGHQLARRGQPVERGTQVFTRSAAHGFGLLDQCIERAVLRQPLDRRLGADLVHAGHVVHRVAYQGEVIDDTIWGNAELLLHPGGVEHLVAHGVDQSDVVVDELGHVLVARGNQGAYALCVRPHGQGTDHVVGLHSRHLQQRPAHQPHSLVNRLDLRHQVGRHRRTLRLVLVVHGVAECRPLGVEHAGRVAIALGHRILLAQAPQHGHHAVERPGGLAFGPAQIGHGVEGAVEIAGTIHQQQGGGGVGMHVGIHPRIINAAVKSAHEHVSPRPYRLRPWPVHAARQRVSGTRRPCAVHACGAADRYPAQAQIP